jgi:hypothetical protein
VIPLGMEMVDKVTQRSPQRALAEEAAGKSAL